jgi:hypothetical protein
MNVRPIAAALLASLLGVSTPGEAAPGGFLARLGWRAPYSHSIVAGGLDVMS